MKENRLLARKFDSLDSRKSRRSVSDMLKHADAPFDDDLREISHHSPEARSEEAYRKQLEQIQSKLRSHLGHVVFRVSSIGFGPDGPEPRAFIAIQGEHVEDAQRLVPFAEVRPLTQEEWDHAQGISYETPTLRVYDPDAERQAA